MVNIYSSLSSLSPCTGVIRSRGAEAETLKKAPMDAGRCETRGPIVYEHKLIQMKKSRSFVFSDNGSPVGSIDSRNGKMTGNVD